MTKEFAIEIKDLRKSFDGGKEFVLNGINLSIPRGSLTVIIGYSGTGKSVLLKHMLGLLKPTYGHVCVLGKDLVSLQESDLVKLRCSFGVLFQNAALFDDLTVLENVAFPIHEHRRYLPAAEIVKIAEKKLHMSGMDTKHFNKLPGELSGGMRKRAGLARALALDPDILLYDEPTTGLDPILTEMVDNLILETHQKQRGSTSIVVSHDLMAAFRIGENVVMLDKGKVLLQGTPSDFLSSDLELVRKFVDKGLKKR
ncbi:MAG: ATP-binding cassette domain-containing protein [Bdellovibrionaceae bacterium]|nr:ATP-binding cassette domain-containing protein [Pseudobdellovibrionaceae bacterium]